ncbi:MAG: hypothetical protein LUQ40_03775, partial [Methanomicrobiales archaeon]|nr:hypothetical protein [Methanomicrobiales archaeon]
MDLEKTYPNLHVLRYVPALAEYAGKVREEMWRRKDTDFVLAIDLPRGLENEVLAAVKRLPEVSIITDMLMRGIPIIPTSAPVEAVRSFHEYGHDMRFLDAALPIVGNLAEYQDFLQLCHAHGLQNVLESPELHGIPREELIQSWKELFIRPSEQTIPFRHVPSISAGIGCPAFSPSDASPYLQARLQCMAMHLKEILAGGMDTLLVCSAYHSQGILHYLGSDIPQVDDSFVVPTKSGIVAESDIPSITTEIPFMMYLYELFRDTPVNRERWIETLCCEADKRGHAPEMIRSTVTYALRLAITDQDLFPSLFNLVAAAKYIVDDDYAIAVHTLARSYPPAKSSTPTIAVKRVFDYNFQPLQDGRSLTLVPSMLQKKRPSGFHRRRTRLPVREYVGYSRWTRTEESYRAEHEFMAYVTSRFAFHVPSTDDFTISEFTGSLGDGVDIRETIRSRGSQRICIREPQRENVACYVFDYRTFHANESGIPIPSYASPVFFDRYHAGIALTAMQGNHYTTGVLAMFSKLSISPTKIFTQLRGFDPLRSAVSLGIAHARYVIAFTDT